MIVKTIDHCDTNVGAPSVNHLEHTTYSGNAQKFIDHGVFSSMQNENASMRPRPIMSKRPAIPPDRYTLFRSNHLCPLIQLAFSSSENKGIDYSQEPSFTLVQHQGSYSSAISPN